MQLEGMEARENLSRFYRVASKSYEETSVPARDVPKYSGQGWEVVRAGKHKSRLRRNKDIDKHTEHRAWSVLYQMGFAHLCAEGGACLRLDNGVYNQLDAVAYDESSGVVVECKASNAVRRVDGQSLIARVSDHRNKIREILNADNAKGDKIKVGGILLLWNTILSETDRERAKHDRILVLDNAAIDYYERLAKHIGFAARYQLLAELFPNQGIDGLRLTVPAVESSMGGKTVYTFAIPPAHLLKIAFIAHRARNDFGTYQRMVTSNRLNKIRKFIDDGGIFPTNIVINFATTNGEKSGLRFDAGSPVSDGLAGVRLGSLHLPAKYQAAWVIDGQHRLLGYSGHPWAETSSLCVTAFDGLGASDQAELFVRINSEQRKVSANHLTALFATLNWTAADPRLRVQAIISKGIQELRVDPDSPFFGRIVLADEEASQIRCITLQYFADALKRPGLFILLEQRSQVRQFGVLWTGDADTTVLRMKRVLNLWFGEIQSAAGKMWTMGDGPGGIVATNRGVTACTAVLRSVCDYLRSLDVDLAIRTDRMLCEKLEPFGRIVGEYFADMLDSELQSLRSHYGSGAPAELAWRLCAHIQSRFQDFAPPGLDKWKADRAEAKVSETHNLTTSIEKRIHDRVFATLKEQFGQDEKDWWRSLPLKVRQAAVGRREADQELHPVETYLNLIDYREIIHDHWAIFEAQFGFGVRGKRDDRTSWMVTINDIRNKASHASGARLKMQDYEKAVEIDQWLGNK